MRTTRVLAFGLLMACSSKAAPPPAAPVAPKQGPSDGDVFPQSSQALLDAESATEPAQIEKLARAAQKQLDEERALSSGGGNDAAYARISTRARIAIDRALLAQNKTIDVLADLATKTLACPATPKKVKATCDELMAGIAAALPNAVRANGQLAEVDAAHVLDDTLTDDAMTAFAKRVATQVGIVVQRVHVAGKLKGDAIEIGGKLRFHVAPADAKRVTGDGVVWMAFDAHSLKKAGAAWDAGKAHVLAIQPGTVSGL